MSEKPFREPKIIEMGRSGDFRRFLLLMEIQVGQIVGGAFKLRPQDERNTLAWAKALHDATAAMLDRSIRRDYLPPASSFEDFE